MSTGDRGGIRAHVGSLRRSVQAAIAANSAAFGFSIVITAALASVSHQQGSPTAWEVLLFGLGGVAAFTALDLVATEGLKLAISRDPDEVITHATAFGFVSVTASIATSIAAAHLLHGLLAWPLASFLAATVYVLVLAAELTIAEAIEARRD